MKILYADLEREWRGGQSQAWFTLYGLKERGHSVELVAAKNSPLAQRSINAGIMTHEVSRFGMRLCAAKKIKHLLERNAYDLMQLNEAHALTSAWLAGAHKKLKLFISRRIGFPLQKNKVSRARYAAITAFIANSEAVAQSLRDSGVPNGKIAVVHEGVVVSEPVVEKDRRAARERFGVRDDEFLFGCVGVFVPEKGQRHLIEALPTVRASHPKARLLLAGDGVCRAELEALTDRLNQRDAVIFTGFLDNVDPAYAALDAFVFPSEFEGLGTSLLAAMALGLPVVSTRRAALAEVVRPDVTGLSAEPDGKAFAAAMLTLIENPELGKKLGAAARSDVANRFSVDAMIRGTLNVYESYLSRQAIAKPDFASL